VLQQSVTKIMKSYSLQSIYLIFILFLVNDSFAQEIDTQIITKYPLIKIETDFGPLQIELYPDKAPVTVSNFLRYVDENRYDDFHFYRVVHLGNQPDNDVKIEVIQGGLGFDKHPMELPSITHETTDITGIKHEDGTISMARLEPGTASSEIFICINAQPELDFGGRRNPDGQGFAAFGKVISGMAVIREIQLMADKGQMLLNPVIIKSILREYKIAK
jgi:peptidyl-prolyl cis-trans isomerase A (cyclophilin A)